VVPRETGGAGSDRARVDLGTFRGYPSVTLAAGAVDATFLSGLGMVGVSLRFDGREYLALPGGIGAYTRGHTLGLPLLHPWANRLGGDRYRAGGRTVDVSGGAGVHREGNGLPIHGTVIASRYWSVERLEATARGAALRACLPFGDHPDLLASFPFPHDLTLEALVDGDGLAVTVTLRSTGRRPVPVSFGWHPYLRLPDARRSSVRLVLPRRDRLEHDERQLPTGATIGEGPEAEPIGRRRFDDGYRLGRDRVLGLEAAGRRLTLQLDRHYPYAQVWVPKGHGFVALEPMTAPTNALVTGEHPTVEPGGSFSAGFIIRVV